MAPFLIVLFAVLIWPHLAQGAEKNRRRPPNPPSAPAETKGVNDVNLHDYFKAGLDHLKNGRTEEALRAFQAVHAYTGDNLQFMKCTRDAYEKALGDPNLAQSQREDLFLKLQRIGTLSSRYERVKGESAYFMGASYSKKGDAAQARRYLLEACQVLPFSLDQASLWMQSKALFLRLSNLEGEF